MNISLLYNVFLGETSPLIAARTDSPAHEMGARRMENMIPMLTGGLRKRPGTWYDGNTYKDREARLIDWLLSDGSCVILELTGDITPGNGTIRAWRYTGENNYQVIQMKDDPYTEELNFSYTAGQIKTLHYASSADEMWIVHPEMRPMKLLWDGSEIVRQLPRFTKGDGDKDFVTENNRPSCVAFESGRLCFAGSNNEPNRIYLSRSPDSQSGEKRYLDFTTEDRYTTTAVIAERELDENGEPKYEYEYIENFAFDLDVANETLTYKNIVYAITSENINPVPGLATSIFAIKTYERKMTLAGGQTIYIGYKGKFNLRREYDITGFLTHASVSRGEEMGEEIVNLDPHLKNLTRGETEWFCTTAIANPVIREKTVATENINITASHAIVLEENDMHGSRIQWLAAHRRLLAATSRATWSDMGEIPTPMTFDMNIIEYAGSSELQARGTKEIMVYAGRDGKSLRALVWNETSQGSGFIDIDISEQAAQLFSAGIKDFAVADNPYSMIWIVTKAGNLISCTINIRGGVLAYARHFTDGIVEAVTVSPEMTGDALVLAVRRGAKRYIEHIILEDLVNADFTESHYVDAGEQREFAEPTNVIDGLDRFAGKTIRVFADGAIEPPVKVSNEGIAELQNKVRKAHIGLPYKAAFSPNERQIPANGTSMGKKRRIEKITLRLYKSLGGRAGTAEEKATELITQRLGEYKLGSAPEPFTGEIDVAVSGNIDTEGKLVITHDEPAPFTMLALVERVAILEA